MARAKIRIDHFIIYISKNVNKQKKIHVRMYLESVFLNASKIRLELLNGAICVEFSFTGGVPVIIALCTCIKLYALAELYRVE